MLDTLQLASALGATGVALGAFGAHALKKVLLERGTTASWATAVQYQLLHAVALLALPSLKGDHELTKKLWVGGVVLFSGSIYGLSLGGPRLLGPVTPLGGLCLIGGWVSLGLK